MTNHVGRLYSLAVALLVFFVLWVGIAAHPWATAAPDPRMTALVAREQHLRHDSVLVQKIVAARFAVYRAQLAERRKVIATAVARQNQANAASAAAVQPQLAFFFEGDLQVHQGLMQCADADIESEFGPQAF